MTKQTLGDLARVLGGRVIGEENISIDGVAGIREAGPGELTFLASARYEPHLKETRAAAILIGEERPGLEIPQLIHDNPYLAYLKAVQLFRPGPPRPAPGVHPTAAIDPSAELGADVVIGPNVVVQEGAVIGDRTILVANVYVGHGVRIGEACILNPQVVIRYECNVGDRVVIHSGTVIGADGFGYVRDDGIYHKVPQVGNVEIGDDVEIGANVCIDRATTGSTVVGAGSKIDNLVQIGHNVRIGENVVVIAQVGISGSTEVGSGSTIAGQAGVAGHIKIGENAIVGAQAGVTKSVAPNSRVSGYPAQPHSVARRIHAFTARLPLLVERLQELEERLRALEAESNQIDVESGR
jgi:UDP-3-O-[3-hydroxymyristoyl] glucosamine N-acyltransferase